MPQAQDDPPVDWEAPGSMLADIDAEQRRGLIDAALCRLPHDQRLALVLYHFEELPYQEIADKLGISLPKVKTDIRRGRAALLGILRSSGLFPDRSLKGDPS